MKRKYNKPLSITINTFQPLLSFNSGWNVDGEHQGNIKEDGDLEWGEND